MYQYLCIQCIQLHAYAAPPLHGTHNLIEIRWDCISMSHGTISQRKKNIQNKSKQQNSLTIWKPRPTQTYPSQIVMSHETISPQRRKKNKRQNWREKTVCGPFEDSEPNQFLTDTLYLKDEDFLKKRRVPFKHVACIWSRTSSFPSRNTCHWEHVQELVFK